jgi:hypothetical protein
MQRSRRKQRCYIESSIGKAQYLSTCFIGRRILWKHSPAGELELTAACILEIDIGS